MAYGEITGASVSGLMQMKQEFLKTPLSDSLSFEEAYCLTRIGKQPEEYSGPTRYCRNLAARREDGTKAISCRFHGGGGAGGVDPLANMSHGFFVNNQNFLDSLADHEQDFYNEVMYDWPEKYGINFDEDPSAMEDMHALARAIIRDERASVEISDRGLTTTKGQYAPDGTLLEREEQAHYLISPQQAQRRLVMKMKDELGISRKHRDVMESNGDASDTVAGLVEGMREALDGDANEYDPDQFTEERPEE